MTAELGGCPVGHIDEAGVVLTKFLIMCCTYEVIFWATTYFCCNMTNWDLQSSKMGPRQYLFKQFLTYFRNIGFVALGFEGS